MRFSWSQLFVALLFFCYDVMTASVKNVDKLKNQPVVLGQTTAATKTLTQNQQHPHYLASQTQLQLTTQQAKQPKQQQYQQHQQPQHNEVQQPTVQNDGTAPLPANSISKSANSVAQGSNTDASALPSALPPLSLDYMPPAQYVVHEKETGMQKRVKHFNTDNDLTDPYHIFNELKKETQDSIDRNLLPQPPVMSAFPTLAINSMAQAWNFNNRPYAPITFPPLKMPPIFPNNFDPFEHFPKPLPVTPGFLPIMAYPQPVYIPYPFFTPPEMFYPSYASMSHLANDYQDSMSRGAGSNQHSSSYPGNSPIYYIRFPPAPYTFLPAFPGFSNILPYRSLSSFPTVSPILNVPINFLANGKPSAIFQMSAPPNDVQNPMQFYNMPSSFNTHPPPPPPTSAYRPALSSHNYFNTQPISLSPSTLSNNYVSYPESTITSTSSSSTPAISSSSLLSQHDSKLIALKRPYFFNGRPEDIYILPNHFDSFYSSERNF